METVKRDAEDLSVGEKFLDVDGTVCVITSIVFELDSSTGCGDKTCCGASDYYWIYFKRENAEEVHYRLWALEELNVIE